MTRVCKTALLALAFALPCAAQTKGTITPFDGLSIDNTLTAPEQIRRVPPPEAGLTAAELERQADQLRMEKSFMDALDYYKAALKKTNGDKIASAQLYNKMGITEMHLLRNDDARKDFDKATKLNPKFATAYNNMGVIYYVKKNFGKAITAYKKAIELDPDTATHFSNLGTAYFAKKDFEQATANYNKALEIDPEIFERKSNFGVNAHMSSPADRARYNYVIARMFATRNDADKCLLYLRKALEDGFPVAENVVNEQEFTLIRKDPRFVALMENKPVAIPVTEK